MGKQHSTLTDSLRQFINAQHVFFVATAPLSPNGHINVSPKGLDSFRILGAAQVAYADLPGSGIETLAHVRENGRIVIMFCAFAGKPNIVRLHGMARAVEPGDADFAALAAHFAPLRDIRSVIVADLERITDSCGFGVPLMDYQGDRDQLLTWMDRKGPEGLQAYTQANNAESIDGLPGVKRRVDSR